MMFKELNEEKKQLILQCFFFKDKNYTKSTVAQSWMFAIRGLGT